MRGREGERGGDEERERDSRLSETAGEKEARDAPRDALVPEATFHVGAEGEGPVPRDGRLERLRQYVVLHRHVLYNIYINIF